MDKLIDDLIEGEVVYIEWIDSVSPTAIWIHEPDYDFEREDADMVCHTIGFFLKMTERAIFVCQSTSCRDKRSKGRIFAIPKCTIFGMTRAKILQSI